METAADGTGIATALLEEALAATGVAAVAVWLAEPDGGLELAGQAGFAARDASRWRRIHPDLRTPALWAADDGTETWWPAGPPDEPGPPGTAATPRIPLLGGWPRGARAVLPLPGPGAPIGALEICWPGPLSGFSRPAAPPAQRAGRGVRAGRRHPAAHRRAGRGPACVLGVQPAGRAAGQRHVRQGDA